MLAEGYLQRDVARMFVCRKDATVKFCNATETLVGHISVGVEVGGVWPQPEKQTVDMNGQGQ